MLPNNKKFIDICKAKGLQVTLQRMAIYSLLQDRTDHPTADEIYREIKKDYPTISLSTVYNTLELLSEHSLIRKVTRLHDTARYDYDTTPHHHVVCRKCNKVFDLPLQQDFEFNLPQELKAKFKIFNYNIQFDGFCPSCSKFQNDLNIYNIQQ